MTRFNIPTTEPTMSDTELAAKVNAITSPSIPSSPTSSTIPPSYYTAPYTPPIEPYYTPYDPIHTVPPVPTTVHTPAITIPTTKPTMSDTELAAKVNAITSTPQVQLKIQQGLEANKIHHDTQLASIQKHIQNITSNNIITSERMIGSGTLEKPSFNLGYDIGKASNITQPIPTQSGVDMEKLTLYPLQRKMSEYTEKYMKGVYDWEGLIEAPKFLKESKVFQELHGAGRAILAGAGQLPQYAVDFGTGMEMFSLSPPLAIYDIAKNERGITEGIKEFRTRPIESAKLVPMGAGLMAGGIAANPKKVVGEFVGLSIASAGLGLLLPKGVKTLPSGETKVPSHVLAKDLTKGISKVESESTLRSESLNMLLSEKMFGEYTPKTTFEIKPATKKYSSELVPEKDLQNAVNKILGKELSEKMFGEYTPKTTLSQTGRAAPSQKSLDIAYEIAGMTRGEVSMKPPQSPIDAIFRGDRIQATNWGKDVVTRLREAGIDAKIDKYGNIVEKPKEWSPQMKEEKLIDVDYFNKAKEEAKKKFDKDLQAETILEEELPGVLETSSKNIAKEIIKRENEFYEQFLGQKAIKKVEVGTEYFTPEEALIHKGKITIPPEIKGTEAIIAHEAYHSAVRTTTSEAPYGLNALFPENIRLGKESEIFGEKIETGKFSKYIPDITKGQGSILDVMDIVITGKPKLTRTVTERSIAKIMEERLADEAMIARGNIEQAIKAKITAYEIKAKEKGVPELDPFKMTGGTEGYIANYYNTYKFLAKASKLKGDIRTAKIYERKALKSEQELLSRIKKTYEIPEKKEYLEKLGFTEQQAISSTKSFLQDISSELLETKKGKRIEQISPSEYFGSITRSRFLIEGDIQGSNKIFGGLETKKGKATEHKPPFEKMFGKGDLTADIEIGTKKLTADIKDFTDTTKLVNDIKNKLSEPTLRSESLKAVKDMFKSKPQTEIESLLGFNILKTMEKGIEKETIVPITKKTKIPRPDKPIKPSDITGLYDVSFERAEAKYYKPDIGEMHARVTMGEGELDIIKTITPKQKIIKFKEKLMERDLQNVANKIFGKELSEKMFGEYTPKTTFEIKPATKKYSSELVPEKLTLEMESERLFIESDIFIKDNKLYELATVDAVKAMLKEVTEPANIKTEWLAEHTIDKGVRTGTFGITAGKALGRRHWAKGTTKSSEQSMKEYDIGKKQQQILQKELVEKKVIEKEISLYEGKPIVSAKDIMTPQEALQATFSESVEFGKMMKGGRFGYPINLESTYDYDYSNVYPPDVYPPNTINAKILSESKLESKTETQIKQIESQIKQEERIKQNELFNSLNKFEFELKSKTDIDLNLKNLNLQDIYIKEMQESIQEQKTTQKQAQKQAQKQIEINKMIQIEKPSFREPPPKIPPVISSTQPLYKQPRRKGIRILPKRRLNPVDINVIFPPQLVGETKKQRNKKDKVTPEQYMNAIFAGGKI